MGESAPEGFGASFVSGGLEDAVFAFARVEEEPDLGEEVINCGSWGYAFGSAAGCVCGAVGGGAGFAWGFAVADVAGVCAGGAAGLEVWAFESVVAGVAGFAVFEVTAACG